MFTFKKLKTNKIADLKSKSMFHTVLIYFNLRFLGGFENCVLDEAQTISFE